MNRLPEHLAWAALAAMLLWPSSAAAQWSYYTAAQSAYDSNPMELNGAPASWLSSFEAGLQYAGARGSVGYTGSLAAYSALDAYDAYWHQLFATFGTDTTSVSLALEQRHMTRDDTYGYRRLGLHAARRFDVAGLKATWYGSAGYYRFDRLSERNQWSATTSMRVAKWFATGTTLLASVGVGYTSYPDMNPSMALYGYELPTTETPATAHLDGTLRLAQSLTPTTGLALQVQRRLLDGSLAPATYAAYDASYALVDDPSIYGARTFGAELTQMLFDYAVTLKAGAYHTCRTYTAQGIYTDGEAYDATEERRDADVSLWFSSTWRSRPAWLGGRAMELQLAGQWTVNDSNSYWYVYDNHYLGLTLILHSR